MRTDTAPLGWGWTVRAGIGLIGLALTFSSNAPSLRAQSGTYGEWKTLGRLMPINPVHAALMNDGRVLIVSGSGNVAAETNFRHAVLDLQADTLTVTNNYPWDMFCNGMVVLSDGRVFVNGGNLKYDPFWGQPKNAVFDPATSLFTDVQNMAHGRWYPTVTTLGDGRVMTFSGLDENGSTNTTVEIYNPSSGWSQPYSAGWTPPLYPRMHLLPDGRVINTGSGTQTRVFNPSSPGTTWQTVVANTNFAGSRGYGTSVLLPLRPPNYNASVMIMGGGNPSTATTEILDTSVPQAQWHWVTKAPMTQPRVQMNATILPNGKILATGGSYRDEDTTTASLNADLYDPVSNTFSSAGQNAYPRVYHSNALLLPDATVLLLGGNPQRGSYEQRMEIYSPAYLFNSNGTPAARPAITSVSPGPFSYGGTFQINTPDAANIAQVVLVRPGAPTHAFDMDQRLVELPFTTGAGTLTATAPPNGNIAPPGFYMLFILNSAGVPSVAPFVQLMPQVNQAPVITSGSSTTFTVGAAGSFTVTATGLPTPSVSESGALPSGVTFVNNGNGTATLSGTPASGTAGTYAFTITASNGVTPAATQSFTLTVTSGGGGGGSNFAYVTGSVTGIVDFGGDTGATLSVALHQAPGAGHLLVCAATWQSATATAAMSDPNNGTWTPIGSAKTGVGGLSGFRGQMFYVPAAANAATTVTLTLGSAVAFRAFECAEFGYTGTIATLDGTPQYSATPAAGGVATVSGLTTTNAGDLVFADCLGVDTTCTTGAGFTGLDDTNTVYKDRGGVGSFLSGTGQLIEFKVGVAAGAQSATFRTGTSTDNVILGLAAATAPATQTAPAITSANSTTFTVGTAGSFTVTATGTPTPSVSESGALPSGVTFVNNGNGTATLSGTPASGTAGIYAITITASNGVTPAATQSFTLTVSAAPNQAPTATIDSPASNVTINPGDAVSFSGSGTDADGQIATYAWTFSGGSPSLSNVAGPVSVTYATPGTYTATFKVTDNGGLTSATQTRTITVADFSVSGSPASVSVAPGNSAAYTATATPGSGFTGTVAFSVTGLPSGATGTFNPASVVASGSSALSVSTSASTPAGTYPLTIRGTSGGFTRTAGVSLVVTAPSNQAPTATIVSPASNMTINPGDTVSFSGSGSDSDGTIAAYAWTFPGGSPGTGNVAGPLNVAYSTPGSYTATFTVTDNGGLASAPQTRAITVADFSLSATTTSGTVAPGASAAYTATVTPSSGFTGAVTFSITGLPLNATASFSPPSVVGSGSTAVTVSTSASTPAGTYPLTIRGTSGGVTRTAAVTLVVTQVGDFTISVSPDSGTVQNGSNATYTVSIGALSGFSSTVALSTGALPKFVTASFSPPSVTQSGTSVLTLTTLKQTKAGTSTITVTGTSGSLVHSVTITLVVQ
jgi:PKD repeat protein